MKIMPSNILVSVLTISAILYACLFLFGALFANKLIFPAPPASYTDEAPGIFKIPSGTPTIPPLSARYYPAKNSKVPLTLLYSHGNGEDLGSIDPRLQALARKGCNVLAYDYPGYGTTGGKASEAATYAAADAAWTYLTQTLATPPASIVFYGRSLGGGPSFYLAEKYPDAAGLIIEGTFTSTFRVLTRIKILPIDAFDNLARMDSIKMPLLLLHGTRDFIVPFSHGKALLRAAPEGTQHYWFESGGHNNLVEDFSEDYYRTLDEFRNQLLSPALANPKLNSF